MRITLDDCQLYWERFCSLLMVCALAITLVGTLGFVDSRAGGRAMGDVLALLMWAFGIAGLFLCFLERAVGRKLLAWLGFGASILALLYGMQAYPCPADEWCDKSTAGYGWFLSVALIALALLLAYDKHRARLPPAGRIALRVFSLPLLVAWAAALIFGVATFNKPIKLRIAPPPQVEAPGA